MNIAFSALLVAILAAPGAFFLASYRRGFNNKPYQAVPFQSNLLLYLLLAVPLHALAVFTHRLLAYICSLPGCSLRDFPIAGSDILALLIGIDSPSYSQAYLLLQANLGSLTFYILALYLVSALLGLTCHRLVRFTALDLRFPVINPHSNGTWIRVSFFFTETFAAQNN